MNVDAKQTSDSVAGHTPATSPDVPPDHVPVILAAIAAVFGEHARVRAIQPSDESPNTRAAWTRGEVPTLRHQQRPEPRKPKWTRSSGG